MAGYNIVNRVILLNITISNNESYNQGVLYVMKYMYFPFVLGSAMDVGNASDTAASKTLLFQPYYFMIQ